jgi:hypothetical protein
MASESLPSSFIAKWEIPEYVVTNERAYPLKFFDDFKFKNASKHP